MPRTRPLPVPHWLARFTVGLVLLLNWRTMANDFGITLSPTLISEGQSATFHVWRPSSTTNSTVVIEVEGDVVAFDPAFEAAGRRLEFAPGDAQKWVTIHALDDLDVDATRTIRLSLVDPFRDGAPLRGTETILTVQDNDVGSLWGDSRGDEGTGLTFTLVRQDGLQHKVSLTFRTLPDPDPTASAIAGVDYVETLGTLTFQPGETTKTIRIETLDNQQTEAHRRWLRLAFESASPFLPGNSFRLELPDDEPLWVRPDWPRLPHRVSEGGAIRLPWIRSGELAGDTRVRLRHRIALRPCDAPSPSEWDLGPNELPSGWQLLSEGTTAGFGPRDRNLWLELMAPDDADLQTTNRCLTVILDAPDRPDATRAWAINLTLDDNETRLVDGSTGVMPGSSDEPAFVPLPDGSAYVLDWDHQGLPVLSRIRPGLDRDPEFRPGIPADLRPALIAPLPSGGLAVAAVNPRDGDPALLALDPRGRPSPDFRPEQPLRSVSALKTTAEGFIYLSDGQRLVRLKPDGKPDPMFQEPEIRGTIGRIWLDGSTVYLGGTFTNFAGLPRTNLGVIRIRESGMPDPEFMGRVEDVGHRIRELVPLESGRLLTMESDSFGGISRLQFRGTTGDVLTQAWGGAFEHLARLENGRIFRASGYLLQCGLIQCLVERSVLELKPDGTGADHWVDVLPRLNWRSFSSHGARQRILSAGNYLWIQEPGSRTYRRLRFLQEGETAFGLVPAGESQLASQSGRMVGAIRRFAHTSDREATATVRVGIQRSDSLNRFAPFELPVTFVKGEVTKPILLPEGFHFTPDSLSEVQVTLVAAPGLPLGGTTSMTSLMVGVPEQPTSYRLAIHRWTGPNLGEDPLLTLTGPQGLFRVDGCWDLNNPNDRWAWFEIYRSEDGWLWDDAPVFRLSPDAPAAVLPVPPDINGHESAYFRAAADE